jgi:hypothetical protein
MDEGKKLYDLANDALYHCKLDIAQALFIKAAQHYTQLARTNHADLNRLNAAVCFYLGGCWIEAMNSIGTIRSAKLNKEHELMYMELHAEIHKRLSNAYWETALGDLRDMQTKGRHKDILNLLKDNPYLLLPNAFAQQMRDACLGLGMLEIAELFRCDLAAL